MTFRFHRSFYIRILVAYYVYATNIVMYIIVIIYEYEGSLHLASQIRCLPILLCCFIVPLLCLTADSHLPALYVLVLVLSILVQVDCFKWSFISSHHISTQVHLDLCLSGYLVRGDQEKKRKLGPPRVSAVLLKLVNSHFLTP